MISTKERNRRLDENNGYLREKIKDVGYAALENLITMKDDPTAQRNGKKKSVEVEMADHCRFLARTWLDKDGDEISAGAKRDYYRRLGFVETKEDDGDDENI